MIREIRIRNFTIIDDLSIIFEPGVNVLTGETGAGKSIIVDAIGLILGDKASPEMIKSGAKEASIEAYFENKNVSLLKELGIDSTEGIIIRRNVSLQGKGRAYINDVSVSLNTLRNLGEALVSIYGQHEHQDLLKKENHLLFLDNFGLLNEHTQRLQTLYNEILALRNKVNTLKEQIRERSQRIEFLRFQIKEIESANLREGERESIEEEIKILQNLNRLKELSEKAYSLLYDSDGSCLEKINKTLLKIREMTQYDSQSKEVLDILEPVVPNIEDAALILRKYKNKYDIDPKRLAELDERLEQLKRLEKKYGEGLKGILSYKERAERELKTLVSADEQLETLESELNSKEREIMSLADSLSKKRGEVAKEIEKMLSKELHELGFQKASIIVDIKKRDTLTARGLDDIEFLFTANPGEPPKPLIKVASGGELSRIMLAIKCLEISKQLVDSSKQTKKDKSPKSPTNNTDLLTLVFDEVDAGIGGITAMHVGKRLKALSTNYQVICITHLPQIAAMADNHLLVQKITEIDKVKVNIVPLKGKDRLEEIARMLSGKITDASLKHAKELLLSET